MADRAIVDAQVIRAYALWPIALLVHGLQLKYMRNKHPVVNWSVLAFMCLSLTFFICFKLVQPDKSYDFLVAFEIVCMSHIVFIEYIASVFPLLAMVDKGRVMVLYPGFCFLGLWVVAGIVVLVVFDVGTIWASPLVVHMQVLGLLVYSFHHTRRQNLLGWSLFTLAIALFSTAMLAVGIVFNRHPILGDLFLLQSIPALMESIGGVYRHAHVARRESKLNSVQLTADSSLSSLARLNPPQPVASAISTRLQRASGEDVVRTA